MVTRRAVNIARQPIWMETSWIHTAAPLQKRKKVEPHSILIHVKFAHRLHMKCHYRMCRLLKRGGAKTSSSSSVFPRYWCPSQVTFNAASPVALSFQIWIFSSWTDFRMIPEEINSFPRCWWNKWSSASDVTRISLPLRFYSIPLVVILFVCTFNIFVFFNIFIYFLFFNCTTF